jgi:hypothetical protein
MNELLEAYNQFSDMSEQFSIKNFKYLMKHIGLFGDACLAALKIFIPVLFIGVGGGYFCGKLAAKNKIFSVFMQGPGYAIGAIAVASLLFIHFMFAVMFQLNANPFITIPVAFTLLNVATVSRVVEENLKHPHDGSSSLIRHLISGLIVTQSTIYNVILFLTLIIVTDIFDIKSSMNVASGATPKNDTREIYGAFIIFFGITAYAIHYLSKGLKKFFTDAKPADDEDDED